MGDITIKILEQLHSTCIEVSYVSAKSTKWCTCEFEFKRLGNIVQTFTVKELDQHSRYNFRIRSRNTEGWSKYSDIAQDYTLALPPKPARPDCLVIKICLKSKVEMGVKMPENACSIKSPIVEWNVKGSAYNLYEATDVMEINEYHEADKSMENYGVIFMHGKSAS